MFVSLTRWIEWERIRWLYALYLEMKILLIELKSHPIYANIFADGKTLEAIETFLPKSYYSISINHSKSSRQFPNHALFLSNSQSSNRIVVWEKTKVNAPVSDRVVAIYSPFSVNGVNFLVRMLAPKTPKKLYQISRLIYMYARVLLSHIIRT